MRQPWSSGCLLLASLTGTMDAQPRPTEPTSATKSTGVAASERPTDLAASARSQMEGVSQDKEGAHQAGRDILQEVRPGSAAHRRRRCLPPTDRRACHQQRGSHLPTAAGDLPSLPCTPVLFLVLCRASPHSRSRRRRRRETQRSC